MARQKITYATLGSVDEELHAEFDEIVAKARHADRTFPLWLAGRHEDGALADIENPADPEARVGRYVVATAEQARRAVRAAAERAPGWRATPVERRAEIVHRAAEMISDRVVELAALMTLENGKNRLEALGEVEETADLLRWYADRALEGDFDRAMASAGPERTRSVLLPYGVWAVVSPFNFPMALIGAPIAAALLTGNTVVGKPASVCPASGLVLGEIFAEAGLPEGVLSVITGPGSEVGQTLLDDPQVAGVTFTGSYDVGMRLYRTFAKEYPKPVVAEMGGKNAALVMRSADLDKATTGVLRSAFGMGGQKCSACSRVFVHADVEAEFLDLLAEKAAKIVVGDPAERPTFLGPVIDERAVQTYEEAARSVADAGATLLTGGKRLDRSGHFVPPALVTGLPYEHDVWSRELFVPFLTAGPVASLDEAIARANGVPYGLTAGLFSENQEEIDDFCARIEAGVIYINRAAGATTGAWPGVQTFGGWKGSGSTGKNIGGYHSLLAYVREQSRTFVE